MAIIKKINFKFMFNLIDFDSIFDSNDMPSINNNTIPNVKLSLLSSEFNVRIQKIVGFNDVSD